MTHRITALWAMAPLAVLVACIAPAPPTPSGAEDFAEYCAACHGTGARGDGEVASTLSRRPPDLTLLARRNGGEFPTTRVMAKIWGYAGEQGSTIMPNFGPLLDSDTVPYDGGDGRMTPTPIRLVQIAEHLQSLQR